MDEHGNRAAPRIGGVVCCDVTVHNQAAGKHDDGAAQRRRGGAGGNGAAHAETNGSFGNEVVGVWCTKGITHGAGRTEPGNGVAHEARGEQREAVQRRKIAMERLGETEGRHGRSTANRSQGGATFSPPPPSPHRG